jgi:hypothetical protein
MSKVKFEDKEQFHSIFNSPIFGHLTGGQGGQITYKTSKKNLTHSVVNSTFTYVLSHGNKYTAINTELPGKAGYYHVQPGAGLHHDKLVSVLWRN